MTIIMNIIYYVIFTYTYNIVSMKITKLIGSIKKWDIIITLIFIFLILIIYFYWKNIFFWETVINIPNDISSQTNWFLLYKNNCNFQKTWDYKYLDIATNDNRIYTKKEFDFDSYTKGVQISWTINEIYLCIIADISDKSQSYSAYRTLNSYYWMIYVYFDIDNQWYINTAYYPPSWQYYDHDSDNTNRTDESIDWKFWSSDTPKKYLLNLESIIVANVKDWWYKYIFPNKLFKDGNILHVWWFMASLWKAYWASSISSYRLIYKWEWEIIIK